MRRRGTLRMRISDYSKSAKAADVRFGSKTVLTPLKWKVVTQLWETV
jgi:hypothetical protein